MTGSCFRREIRSVFVAEGDWRGRLVAVFIKGHKLGKTAPGGGQFCIGIPVRAHAVFVKLQGLLEIKVVLFQLLKDVVNLAKQLFKGLFGCFHSVTNSIRRSNYRSPRAGVPLYNT